MRAAREEIQMIFSGPDGSMPDEKESVNLSREQLDNMPVLGKQALIVSTINQYQSILLWDD